MEKVNMSMDDEKLLMNTLVNNMFKENKKTFREFMIYNIDTNVVVNDGEATHIVQLRGNLINEVEKVYYVDDDLASILLHNGRHMEIRIL